MSENLILCDNTFIGFSFSFEPKLWILTSRVDQCLTVLLGERTVRNIDFIESLIRLNQFEKEGKTERIDRSIVFQGEFSKSSILVDENIA